jgi:hypothetical protein
MMGGRTCSQRFVSVLQQPANSLKPRSLHFHRVFHKVCLDAWYFWMRCLDRCTLLLNGEERAVSSPNIPRLIETLNQLSRVFPPLKRLVFETFWFVFAAVEIVRFLRSLL